MLAPSYKHSSEKLHLVLHLQQCCQHSDAAQETLLDMTNQAGLQSGLSSERYYGVTLRQHQGPQIVSFLLFKAVLAQCDYDKVLGADRDLMLAFRLQQPAVLVTK